jgi:(p)ppGpp synthase/HD superfamily hydrolase
MAMHGYSDRINHALTYLAKHYAPRAPVHAPHPFLAHPSNVAIILARHDADETTMVAAIVHHLIEVAPTPDRDAVTKRLGQKFGSVVTAIASDAAVGRVDHYGEPTPWRHRKREILTRLGTVEPRALDIRCADEIHECGTAIAIVQRLGVEYLEPEGRDSVREIIAWYDDLVEAIGRRVDWPARTMGEELRTLAGRLDGLVRTT